MSEYSERFSYSNDVFNFEPRNEINNTHKNTVDENISSIIPYVKLDTRYLIVVVLYFVTLGILFILTLFFPTLILSLYCQRVMGSSKDNIDYVEIIDINNVHYVCKVERKNVYKPHPKLEKLFKDKSKLIFDKANNPNYEEVTFLFKNVKYNIIGNTVKPAFVSLYDYANQDVINEYQLTPRVKNLENLNLLLNQYGPNETMVESMNMTFLVIRQFIKVFHLYCIVCSILWVIFSHYILYALIIIILNVLAIVFCINHEYDLAQKIYNISCPNNEEDEQKADNKKEDSSEEDDEDDESMVKDNKEVKKDTKFFWDNDLLPDEIKKDTGFLVPGEIVKLGGDYTLPFDGIILEGFCTVDESELTGETNEVYKKALPNSGETFDYKDKTHFLFQGTQLKQVASEKKKDIEGLIDDNTDIRSYKSKEKENLGENSELELHDKSFEYDYELNSKDKDKDKDSENKDNKDKKKKKKKHFGEGHFENGQRNDTLTVLVLNTGMNTDRANLLLNLAFSKKENHSFNCDLLFFTIIMLAFWLTILILNIKFDLGHIKNLIELMSVFLPPSLFVSITFSSYCVKKSLKKENIDCVDINKITVAGKANVIILDKTGTLTEDQFELYGYQFTYPYTNFSASGGDDNCEQEILLSDLEKSSKILNKIHQKYWKEYNDFHYQFKDDLRFNIVYFTECLGSCHSIDTFEDKNLGDAIDKKIFESIKWMIQNEDDRGVERRCVMPKNLYKISEKAVFSKFSRRKETKSLIDDEISTNSNLTADLRKSNAKKVNGPDGKIFTGIKENYLQTDIKSKDRESTKSSRKKDDKIKSYKLYVEKIYNFSSDTQSMTVITYNTIDKTRRIYKKGAPEKILENCLEETKPKDINEQIMKLAEGGLRVLAFSTRVLANLDTYKEMSKEELKEYEEMGNQNGFTFLGLVAFKNPLKKDTQTTIKKLYDAKFQLAISTGDNEYTSFYVAKQSNMINATNKIRYVLDIDKASEFVLTEHSNIREEMNSRNRLRRRKKPEETVFLETKSLYENVKSLSKTTKKFTLSCSGKALSKLIELKNKPVRSREELIERNELCTFVKKFGVIFYRMLPKHKADLVSFFKEDNKSVVIMCGDGSNDIPAILEADIGITLNQQKNLKILSHFSMNNSSIRCIEIIVRSGRGCFENNEVTFKFLINYGAIQLVSFILLNYTKLPLFSLYQRFYRDCFCSLIPNLLGNLTSPSMVLADETIGTSLMNMKMIISTILQLIIQIGFLVAFYYYIKSHVYYENEYGEIITYSFDDFLCKGTISVAGTVS
ncbi:MAG: hypothetical protein MJ252_06705 [archaeon]|nr:hypothetical protein [archaeon]